MSTPASILIVDDTADNRELLCRRIEQQGHATTTAENGKLALELLAKQSFDLVLLDIMMPELTGFEVLERMKADERLKRIPVIVISALNDIESIVRCVQSGAEDYLFKPFKADQIVHTMRQAARSYVLERSHDQLLEQLRRLNLELEQRVRVRTAELEEANRELHQKNSIQPENLTILER